MPRRAGRVIRYFALEKHPLVRADGTAVMARHVLGSAAGRPSRPLGRGANQGCMDITALNPPPSPGEVFSYFERLPLPS